MKRLIHFIPLCLQTAIWWAFLRGFPALVAHEEKALNAFYQGRPLPHLTTWILTIAHIPQGISYEWNFVSVIASATYLFLGFMLLVSTTNLSSALQRSYTYQTTFTVTLAFLSVFSLLGALIPFVTIIQGLIFDEPKPLTAREIFWEAFTWTYLLLLALIAGWRLFALRRKSKDRRK